LLSERDGRIASFLESAGLAGAARQPLPGDASTRRYERLATASGARLILMDQPPNLETAPCPPEASPAERRALGFNAMYRLAAGRVDAFVACAGFLRGRGLSAPAVVAHDAAAGLAVLEDLGDSLYASVIAAGADEAPLYEAAIDALVTLHRRPPPAVLEADGARWDLLDYDDLALKTAGELFIEWLPRLHPQIGFGDEAAQAWEEIWAPVRARAAAGARVFCHRDYHAENLLWLDSRQGAARVGLLDFQDALRAHPAWDLSMLLHDARRDVSAERETASLQRYLAARPGEDREAFLADYHALGALNVARILGIFSRLVARDGKPRYRAFMPRLWTYLDRCLAGPAPAGLTAWFARFVPAQARA
jgi:aminoglycoside/choline kinase family phosphotransferase